MGGGRRADSGDLSAPRISSATKAAVDRSSFGVPVMTRRRARQRPRTCRYYAVNEYGKSAGATTAAPRVMNEKTARNV